MLSWANQNAPRSGDDAELTDYDVTDEVGSDHSGYLENVSDLMVSHMG